MQLDMTKGKPLPVILRFTIPLVIGNVFQQLYNMADTIIVGRFVGAGALAAVGSTGTIMFLLTGFSQGITAGFTILTSQRYGAGNDDGVRRSVANGILLAVLVALFLSGASLLVMKPLLGLMNTPADIFADAYIYIMVISVGLAANIFYNLFSAFLRSVGNSQVPLFFLVFSAILNVGLDLLFIVNLGMGVAGAAWATNLAQGVSAVLCLAYILAKVPVLRPAKGQWRLGRSDSRYQLIMGIPMAFQFAITASGIMIMQAAINLFGSSVVAAYTAACKLQNLFTQGMVAMGQTMATYSGQNFGKGDAARIRAGVRAALLAEALYSVAAGILVCVLLEPSIGLFFSGDVDVSSMLPWAEIYTHLCVIFFIPLSVIFIFRNVMQGCGYGFLPMMGGVSELIARLVVAMAAMRTLNYLLACFCDPAAWVIAGVFTGVSYLIVIRKVEKRLVRSDGASAIGEKEKLYCKYNDNGKFLC